MLTRAAADWALGALVALLVLLCAFSALAAGRARGDRFTLEGTRAVRSGVDGLPYRVHLVHGGSARAADRLALLNRRAVELLRHLRRKYLRGAAGRRHPARARAAARLLALYNPDNLAENSPRDPEGDTSYTIDKGAILALCLREKGPAAGPAAGPGGAPPHALHDLETLSFVVVHELSHIAIEDLDHPPRFWRAFKFLLSEAREAGLLRGVDYARAPVVYCGMAIDYSPLHDPALPPLD
jgi:hypothetical protein